MSGLNRNDLCPCGSGKKYKKCCLAKVDGVPHAFAQPADRALAEAVALHQAGQLAEALDAYKEILRENPLQPDALHLAGVIALQTGLYELAIDLIGQAIDVKPHFLYYCHLGNAFKAQGQPDSARECYGRSLALKPDHAESHYNLGVVLQELGELGQAVERYRQAVSINPDYAEALGNLGVVLQLQGKVDEAIEWYKKALSIAGSSKDSVATVSNNLSMLLKDRHRLVEALAYARRAVELNPQSASAHQSLASLLAHLSDYSAVCAECDTALALNPSDKAIWESRLYVYSYHPDLSVEDIYGQFVRWGDRFSPSPANEFLDRDRNPGRRLRVGYMSPDFRQHTSRFMFETLFSHHDRSQVELFAYSNVKIEDRYTQMFKGLFDEWRTIRDVSDDAAAAMIRADRIDILIDACGHMAEERLALFALKPAPIQATWLGSVWTTGLAAIDYVFHDQYMAPVGTLTREKIVRIPCVGAFNPLSDSEVVATPALKNGYVTFGYSGRTERLNHRVFRAWAEILRRLPDTRLILDFMPFADPQTQAYYAVLMAGYGIDVDRVTMRSSADIFAGLGDFDILLDSFPHCGGTMISDALWMGVPVLTLASRPTVGRIGVCEMSHLGLFNWIADSEDEYVDKAVAFACDVESLKTLRPTVRGRMKRSLLMNNEGFAKSFDIAFRMMWRRWCEGLPPCEFDVPSESPAAWPGDGAARRQPGVTNQ